MKATRAILEAVERASREGRVRQTGVNAPRLVGPQVQIRSCEGLSEKEFQAAVVDFAQACGWRVASFRKVRVQRKNGSVFWETPVGADGAGWPDLELVRERIVKVELKVGKNKLDPEQKRWRDAYLKAGVEWYVWYPRDIETITEVLK